MVGEGKRTEPRIAFALLNPYDDTDEEFAGCPIAHSLVKCGTSLHTGEWKTIGLRHRPLLETITNTLTDAPQVITLVADIQRALAFCVIVHHGFDNVATQEKPMKRAMLFCLALFLAVGPALTAAGQTDAETPSSYTEDSPSGAMMLVDGIAVRPVSFIAIAVGIVGTVATLPFSLPSGKVNRVAQKLIAEPFAFTFTRPLGVFPDHESLD
jgi:hypothetical protein